MPHIDFWFDFISPYAYFGFLRIGSLAREHGATLRYRPVLFAALLDHHGHLGPAEIPSKREHTFRDVVRYAVLNDVPLEGVAAHPFNPIPALRCVLPEVAGADQETAIHAIFDAGWGNGADLGDPGALAAALTGAGLDGPGMVAKTRDPAVKEALKAETAAALERGVFGVPTFDVDGELFWGNDRIGMVRLRLEGRDPLPEDAVQRLLTKPSGVVRPGSTRR